MKKILLAFDGSHFSEGAFEFARTMNEMEPILLLGVFLPQANYANLWSYAGAAEGSVYIPLLESDEAEEVQQNIEKFKRMCAKNDIDYRVHKELLDFALPELKKETRFADLVILGSESFYANISSGAPNDYLKEAIHAAECPVLIVPEKFDFPESTILAYDGSESSVFAIKQFAYLFPQLCNNKTLLVYANGGNENFPNETYIEELAARHFKNMTLYKLEIDPKKYFATWINEKKSSMLVSGAYGRSSISQLFKKSFVTDVIGEHQLPVFIAHR